MRFLSVLLVLIPLMSYADDEFFNCHPVDNGKALINPGMGWNFALYSNAVPAQYLQGSTDQTIINIRNGDDVLDTFPGCSTAFFRFGWSWIQQVSASKFTWDTINDRSNTLHQPWNSIINKWIAKGKRVAFCWDVCYPGYGNQSAPTWLRQLGAKGRWIASTQAQNPDSIADSIVTDVTDENALIFNTLKAYNWVPNYDDPVFLRYLELFIKAAAVQFDGNPNVDFIEIGSLGIWGEGHTYFSGGTINYGIQKTHIDLWKKYFKKTLVLVNDEYADPSGLCHYDTSSSSIIQYAFSQGCGFTDHSIHVRRLVDDNNNIKSPFDLTIYNALKFWCTLPVTLENDCGVPPNGYRPGTPANDDYYIAVEKYHASFLRLHAVPSYALSTSQAIIDKINKRLGYRFQIAEAGWTKSVQQGKPFNVVLNIRNGGVAPCYRGGKVSVYLKINDNDTMPYLSLIDTTFNVKNLMPSSDPNCAPIKQLFYSFSIPSNCPSSKLSVYVSVLDSSNKPYALPYPNDDGKHRYKLTTSPSNDFIYKYLLPIIPGF
jgi:hypothetical protein